MTFVYKKNKEIQPKQLLKPTANNNAWTTHFRPVHPTPGVYSPSKDSRPSVASEIAEYIKSEFSKLK